MKPKKRKNKRYLDTVKFRIVEESLEGNLTKAEVDSKYGISITHIKYWMCKFGFLPTANKKETTQQIRSLMESQQNPKEVSYLVEIQALKAKIQRLNKALEEAIIRAGCGMHTLEQVHTGKIMPV